MDFVVLTMIIYIYISLSMKQQAKNYFLKKHALYISPEWSQQVNPSSANHNRLKKNSKKISLDISCESSVKQMIHMKCQDLFCLKRKKKKKKKKKKRFSMPSANLLGTLRVYLWVSSIAPYEFSIRRGQAPKYQVINSTKTEKNIKKKTNKKKQTNKKTLFCHVMACKKW